MKLITILGVLLLLVFFISCSKQQPLPTAVLSLRLENSNDDVEWSDVSGSRYANSDKLFIAANGFNQEQFHLELDKVTSIGLVQNVTAKNISYSNIYGFTTGSLQSVQILITDISRQNIYGRFEAAFINHSNSADIIKAKGSFSILGQE